MSSDGESSEEVLIGAAVAVGKCRPVAGASDIGCSVCGRYYDTSRVLNIGDKAYAVFRCKRCHKAVRMLQRSAESRGDAAKEALASMKKSRKDAWKRLVCNVRINWDDDPQCVWDLPASTCQAGDSSVRAQELNEASATSAFTNEVEFQMLTKRQFKAHMVYKEMYGKEEAECLWAAAMENKDLHKETDDRGVTTVAVKMPKVYRAAAGLAKERSVIDATDLDETLPRVKQLATVPDTSQALGADLGHSFFNPGKHFVVSDSDEKEKAKAMLVDGASTDKSYNGSPALSRYGPSLKRARSWEECSVASGASLPDMLPEGSDPQIVDLVVSRSMCTAKVKGLLAMFVDKKSSCYNILREMISQKLGNDHQEVVALGLPAQMTEFQKITEDLGTTLKKAPHWTQGCVKAEVDKVHAALERSEVLLEAFAHAVTALKKVRKLEVATQTNHARKIGAHARTVMGKGALAVQGLPKPMCGWMGTAVLKLELTQTTPSLDLVDDPSVKRNEDAGTLGSFLYLDGAKSLPMLDAAGKLLELCKEATEKMVPKLRKRLDDNPNVYHNISRVKFKATGLENFNGLKWAKPLTDAGLPAKYMPTACAPLGKPWLLAQKPWAVRWGSAALPYSGCSALVVPVEGPTLLVVWPLAAVVATGAAVGDMASFFGNMTQHDFQVWMARNAHYVLLKPAQAAFIPFGMDIIMVSMSEKSHLLLCPWFSDGLWSDVPVDTKDLVRQMATEFTSTITKGALLYHDRDDLMKFVSQ